MTQQVQLRLEQRFIELKASVSSEHWVDASYLLKKVEELEVSDIALAFRLMQRVKNLSPIDTNQQKLRELRKSALQEIPELATLSSTESKSWMNLKGNAQSLKEQMNEVMTDPKITKFMHPFTIFVVLPFLLFSCYQVLLASPQYESQAKLIVKEPDAMTTLDPAMAIMSGFGVGAGNLDTELVKEFINSNDMLIYLEEALRISQHYSDSQYDFISRLDDDASRESILSYYLDSVQIEIDDSSQVISIFVQAFEPDFANLMSKTIVERAEWYINDVGHNLAKKQLAFVKQEHQFIERRLQKSKSELLAFQRRHNLLDPQAEGLALQQITYQLEGMVASKQTELIGLRSSMSESAPQVIQAKSQVNSMLEQLKKERSRLTSEKAGNDALPEEERNLSVSQILARFSDYKINMELALQAYTFSQVSLEKSRIEAYRQLKYIVTVESPTHPQEAKYPEVLYNISLFLAVTLMLFGMGRIVIATVSELR